jgi:hypothetical protein
MFAFELRIAHKDKNISVLRKSDLECEHGVSRLDDSRILTLEGWRLATSQIYNRRMRICDSSVCHDGLYSCLCDMRMRVERVSRVDGTAGIVGASCVATSAAQKFKHRDLVCVNVYRVVVRDHRGERISTA